MTPVIVIISVWSALFIAVCLLAMFDVEDGDEDTPEPLDRQAVVEDRAATVYTSAKLWDDGGWLGWLAFYGIREPEDVP